jgi:hypothetical protein
MRVEPGLVADERAGDDVDPERPHLAGKVGERPPVERRVAVSLQDQAPPPHLPVEEALAAHLCADAEPRPERLQHRVGDGELLVRSRREREPRVLCEHDAATGEVDRDRSHAARVEGRPLERGGEAGAQRGMRSRREQRGESDKC